MVPSTYTAARFDLDKVGCGLDGVGVIKRTLLSQALLATNVRKCGYQDIAAVREDAAHVTEFHTSQDLLAALKTEGSGEHGDHCN